MFSTVKANSARVEQLAARASSTRRSLNEVALDDNASASLSDPSYDPTDHSASASGSATSLGAPVPTAWDDNASVSLRGPPYDDRGHSVGRTSPGIAMGPPYTTQEDYDNAILSDPSYDATDHSASASGSATTAGAPARRKVHWDVDVV